MCHLIHSCLVSVVFAPCQCPPSCLCGNLFLPNVLYLRPTVSPSSCVHILTISLCSLSGHCILSCVSLVLPILSVFPRVPLTCSSPCDFHLCFLFFYLGLFFLFFFYFAFACHFYCTFVSRSLNSLFRTLSRVLKPVHLSLDRLLTLRPLLLVIGLSLFDRLFFVAEL